MKKKALILGFLGLFASNIFSIEVDDQAISGLLYMGGPTAMHATFSSSLESMEQLAQNINASAALLQDFIQLHNAAYPEKTNNFKVKKLIDMLRAKQDRINSWFSFALEKLEQGL